MRLSSGIYSLKEMGVQMFNYLSKQGQLSTSLSLRLLAELQPDGVFV